MLECQLLIPGLTLDSSFPAWEAVVEGSSVSVFVLTVGLSSSLSHALAITSIWGMN